MMHFVRTVSITVCALKATKAYCYEEVRNYEKILFIQSFVENGWWGNTYAAYPTFPPRSTPGCITTKDNLKLKRDVPKILKAAKARLL